jgi:hypothetical protein
MISTVSCALAKRWRVELELKTVIILFYLFQGCIIHQYQRLHSIEQCLISPKVGSQPLFWCFIFQYLIVFFWKRKTLRQYGQK